MKAKLSYFIISLIITPLLLGILSCSKKSTGEDVTEKIHRSTVEGRVVDKNGDGLSGVTVTTEPAGYSTTTTSDGSFSLPDIEAADHRYRLHFHLVDYLDAVSDSIEIGIAETIALDADVVLTFRYASITGTVKDASGAGLIGAGIIVEKQGIFTMSYSGGEYVLNRVEPGDLKLLSAKEGAGTGLHTVTVAADQELTGEDIVQQYEGGSVSGQLLQGDQGIFTQKRSSGGDVAADPVPMANAEVSAVGGAVSSSTDSLGYFTLEGVPSGGVVVLSVVYGGDTLQVGGVEVAEQGAVDIQSVTVHEAVTANNMTLLPTTTKASSDSATVTLLVGSETSGDAVIESYDWDTDNNGTFDTTTATGRLEVPTGGAGTRYVRVQATDTAGNQSEVAYLTVDVSETKVIPVSDTTGIVNGAVAYTGTLATVGADTPIVAEAFAATDVNYSQALATDTITSFPGTYAMTLTEGDYRLRFYLDLNGDGALQTGEPYNFPLAGTGTDSIPVTADTVITFHVSFGDENVPAAEYTAEPGTYAAEYMMISDGDTIYMKDTMIVNSDNSYKGIMTWSDRQDSSGCFGMRTQGRGTVVDSLRISEGVLAQNIDLCLDTSYAWFELSGSDTSELGEATATSITVRYPNMQSMTGGDWITYTKISEDTDMGDWVFDAAKGYVIVTLEYTGAGTIGYQNALVLMHAKDNRSENIVTNAFYETPVKVYLGLEPGNYALIGIYDADGDRDFTTGDAFEMYVEGNPAGTSQGDSATEVAVSAGDRIEATISFDDTYINASSQAYLGIRYWSATYETLGNQMIMTGGGMDCDDSNDLVEDTRVMTWDYVLSGDVIYLTEYDTMEVSGAVVKTDENWKRVGSGNGLEGIWNIDTGRTCELISGTLTQSEQEMFCEGGPDSDEQWLIELTGDSALIYIDYLPTFADSWVNEWQREDTDGFYSNVEKISDDIVRLTIDSSGEVITVTLDREEGTHTYESTDPSHPTHVFYHKTVSCPNDDEPDWLTEFGSTGSSMGTWQQVFLDDFNRADGPLTGGLTAVVYPVEPESGSAAILDGKLLVTNTALHYMYAVNYTEVNDAVIRVSAICSTTVKNTGSMGGDVSVAVTARRTDSGQDQDSYSGGFGTMDSMTINKSTIAGGWASVTEKQVNIQDNTAYLMELTVNSNTNEIMSVITDIAAGISDTLRYIDNDNPFTQGFVSINGYHLDAQTVFFDNFKVERLE
ncbi:carboxypeptidase-like regulatory domain-containing protein [Fibrobacterota bacterium]